MIIRTAIERFPLTRPFRIAGRVFEAAEVVVASIEADGLVGRGEASGVFYRGETAETIAAEIARIDGPIDRDSLAARLPPGGARNALDCALWDLEAKRTGRPVWQLAGLAAMKPLLTTITLGADTPGAMVALAMAFPEAPALKLKLVGDADDAERVRAVRAARPAAWLAVDANQSLTRERLDALMPCLVEASVKLIEQPFPSDRDHELDGLRAPIPIAADESVQDRHDLARLVGRFDLVNIKLDKSGGLTEALAMVAAARRLGLGVMVGCMTATSLAMAPGCVVGQLADLADLDGCVFLAADRVPRAVYAAGHVTCPDALWGAP